MDNELDRLVSLDELDEFEIASGDRHVLIPIGYARRDQDGGQVFADALASADITTLPGYTHALLTRDVEASVRPRLFGGRRGVDVELRDDPRDRR